jgi:hypothetical protein
VREGAPSDRSGLLPPQSPRVPGHVPAVFGQIGDQFRRSVSSYAEANQLPVVRLKTADRNAELIPYAEDVEAMVADIQALRPYVDACRITTRRT